MSTDSTNKNYHCRECGFESSEAGICTQHGTDLVLKSHVLPVSDVAAPPALNKAAEYIAKLKGITEENRPELPAGLGLLVKSAPVLHESFTEWSVAQKDVKSPLIYRRYRAGSLTVNDVYEKLKGRKSEFFPTLEAYGAVKLASGEYLDYELTREQAGQPLTEWLKEKSADESRGLELAVALFNLLKGCVEAGVLPMTLSPNDLLVTKYKHEIRVSLTHLGSLMIANGLALHRRELNHSLLPAPYIAPELSEKRILTANAAVFSVGEIIWQAATGTVVDIADVREGRIAFSAFNDAFLARLVMGCMHPESAQRFGLKELKQLFEQRAVERKWPVASWERVGSKNAEAFQFNGSYYYRYEELTQALIASDTWDQALAILPKAMDWISEHTAFASVVAQLKTEDRSPDWKLMRLCYTLRPDLPRQWRNLSLSNQNVEDSLHQLAQWALNGEDENKKLVDQLFKADLRNVFPDENTSKGARK